MILDEVRRAQACLVDQALRLGLRSLGVPIADRAGVMRAALSASVGVAEPVDPLLLRGLLHEAAEAIGSHL